MGVFQKVNEWLAEKGGKTARGGDANRIANNAYYASGEAQQAYAGIPQTAQDTPPMSGDTGRTAPSDRFSGDASDKYNGRVPYRSQKDMQAEAGAQRQQAEEQQRRQMAAMQQQKAQQFGRSPAAQAAYPQQAQAPQGNVLPFPNMIRGPEGNYYAHVEYVVLLRSRNECTKVIEYIKANASVFLNMEFIANDSERQRCVDMLSGAAYTLGCQLSKISQRGIYLISSPSVYVVIDPAMQKFAATPEAQGYVRPEYASAPSYAAGAQAYPAQPQAGYGAQAGSYAARQTMGGRTAGYTQQGSGYGSGTTGYDARQMQENPAGMNTSAYAATAGGYAAGASTSLYAAQNNAYNAGANTSPYAAQGGTYAAGANTAPYAAQANAYNAGANTSPYAAQGGTYAAGANTAPYAAQANGYNAGANTSPYAAQGDRNDAAQARSNAYAGSYTPAGAAPVSGMQRAETSAATPHRRASSPFGMQGAFVKSAEGSPGR